MRTESPNKNPQENSPSSVLPFEQEEEPIRDTLYSPEQHVSPSSLQSSIYFPVPDEFSLFSASSTHKTPKKNIQSLKLDLHIIHQASNAGYQSQILNPHNSLTPDLRDLPDQ